MAYIKLKDGKVIKISQEKAEKADVVFKNPQYKGDTVLAFDENPSFTKSMIAYVVTQDEDDSSQAKKSGIATHMQEMVRNQHEEFEQILSLTPENRSLNTDYFSFYFFALTFRKPNGDEIEKAKIIQSDYFKEHDFVYPHPKIFHDIIRESNPAKEIGGHQKELSGTAGQLFVLGAKYVRRSEYAANKRAENYAA